jgi:cytochrome b
MTEDTTSRTRVRVWDVPTRLLHWLLVGAFAVSWWTGKSGRLEWHQWSGYLVLGLIVFRIYWGFVGSPTARFAAFLRGPRTIASYLRGRWPPVPGHNPLGALSVIGLLGLTGVQVALGLFAVDVDGIESGPLSMYVSFETGRAAAEWHDTVFNVLLWLVVLHIVAIAWYRFFRREKLLGAMVHGMRELPGDPPSVAAVSVVRLIIGVLLAAAFTWLVIRAFQL